MPADADAVDCLHVDRREALRARLLGETPWYYNPWVHLALPSMVGLLTIGCALARISALHIADLLAVPITYVFANFVEWWAHANLLHKRHPLAPILYDKHTPEHHMIYDTENMAMRDRREFRLVLIPAYGIGLIVLATIPVALGICRLGQPNAGWLYLATAVGYAVAYEWLHLSYHLGPDTWIGRRRVIGLLRCHHAIHHDPRLMQQWNLNVTVPLADLCLGTVYRGHRQDFPPPERSQPVPAC